MEKEDFKRELVIDMDGYMHIVHKNTDPWRVVIFSVDNEYKLNLLTRALKELNQNDKFSVYSKNGQPIPCYHDLLFIYGSSHDKKETVAIFIQKLSNIMEDLIVFDEIENNKQNLI